MQINLNDIRINNIVILNGTQIIVNLDFFKKLNNTDIIYGIELNEDLLIKLKFRKQINWERDKNGNKIEVCPYYFDTQLGFSKLNRTSGLYCHNNKIRVLGGHIYNDLTYLHQLQNWFYTSTGEEFLINIEDIK